MDVAGQAVLSDVIATRAVTEMIEDAVHQHARFVYRLAYAVLRNHHEAEDVTQETFIHVWRRAKQLPDVQNQRAWLARIAWRVISRRRKKRTEQSLDSPGHWVELAGAGTGAEQELIQQERRTLLDQMVATLSPQLRQVIALSTVEELSGAEIAEILRIPESSVRGRLLRARQILQRKLQPLIGGKK
jgi:RNA polymerase sigma-70 factor (ECF subfamily)